MTREEAIKVIRKMLACTDLSVRANLTADMVNACDLAIKALEQESILDKPHIKGDYYDGFKNGLRTAEWRYDKLRAEIRKKMKFNSFNEGYVLYDDIIEVFNKYKTESEG